MILTALALSAPLAAPQTSTGLGLPRAFPRATDASVPLGWVERMDEHGRVARVFVEPEEGQGLRQRPGRAALVAADWAPIGPFGGDVADVAVSTTNASVVLAALAPSSGGGGLYRSTAAGASWTEVASLSGLPVYDIEFDPSGDCYIGTLDGPWKSVDGGASWVALSLGIGLNEQTFEITIDPNDPTRLWAGVGDALGNQTNTLLLSTDSGVSWTPMVPPGGPYSFTAIEVLAGDSNKVFAAWRGGFGGGGCFVSSDGGASWVDRSAGLPGNPVNDLLHDGTRLLLCGGQLFGGQDVGVYTTADEGLSWTELSDGSWPVRAITDLELDPTDAQHLLCTSQGDGVFESLDGGASWSFGAGGTGGLASNAVSFVPGSGTTIYLGSTSNAVWKSVDGGASYGASSVGIGQLDVYSVATNPNDPLEIAIAFQGQNSGGVQSSTDGGATWTNEVVPGTRFSTVGFAPDGVLFAISAGPTTIAPEGLYRRTLSGWASIGPDQGSVFESDLVALAFDPTDPFTILSGGADFGAAGFEPTIWRTTNYGADWTKVYEGRDDNEDVNDIVFPDSGSEVVVACYSDSGASQTGGAMRSVDGGASWADASSGLPAGAQGRDLDLHPDGLRIRYADGDAGVGNGGIHESVDLGLSWTAVGPTGLSWSVTHHPGNGSQLFKSGNVAPRVQASEDDGASFAAYDAGLFTSGTARGLHFDVAGAVLYLASNQGVWTTDFEVGTGVCLTSPNSAGPGARITGSGSASVAANDLSLMTIDLPPNKPGLYYYGSASIQVPFGAGWRCVGAGGTGVFRLGVVTSSPGGVASKTLDYTAQLNPSGVITAGSTWFFQFWYRDPGFGGRDFNLSDALQVDFVP